MGAQFERRRRRYVAWESVILGAKPMNSERAWAVSLWKCVLSISINVWSRIFYWITSDKGWDSKVLINPFANTLLVLLRLVQLYVLLLYKRWRKSTKSRVLFQKVLWTKEIFKQSLINRWLRHQILHVYISNRSRLLSKNCHSIFSALTEPILTDLISFDPSMGPISPMSQKDWRFDNPIKRMSNAA